MGSLKLFFIAGLAWATIGCQNQDKNATVLGADTHKRDSVALADTANYTSIQWIDSVNLELGKVNEGQVVDVSWRFKNAGNKPLIITSVNPGCGCTASKPPKEPIAPGQEGVIEAKFDSKGQSEGKHTKSVSVTANTKEGDMHNLTFSVDVVKQ
jgi:hypothetical protein